LATVDGFETQFGGNHLGHFVLINRIASLIRTGGRLVNVSSAGHRISNVDLKDPNVERTPYAPLIAYGRSKTANILFAVAFDQRHRSRGVRAAAVHPGAIQTELGRYMEPAQLQSMIDRINQQLAAEGKGPFEWKTIPQGAATSVWAGVLAAADEIGGAFAAPATGRQEWIQKTSWRRPNSGRALWDAPDPHPNDWQKS
jgi:NAD(P)-dependent dehydrogenase (short-subunit alcohol dehydrogenase family)